MGHRRRTRGGCAGWPGTAGKPVTSRRLAGRRAATDREHRTSGQLDTGHRRGLAEILRDGHDDAVLIIVTVPAAGTGPRGTPGAAAGDPRAVTERDRAAGRADAPYPPLCSTVKAWQGSDQQLCSADGPNRMG